MSCIYMYMCMHVYMCFYCMSDLVLFCPVLLSSGRRKRKYHVELGHRKVFRRFKILCCCCGHRGSSNRSTSLAMQDAAKALHTVFSDLDFVVSDVVAGLILLKKDQRKKKLNCGCAVCVEVS